MEPQIKDKEGETPTEEPKPEEEEEEEEDMDNQFFHYREIKTFENIPPNTIDDDLFESIGREVLSMGFKFSVVLCPTEKRMRKLKSWDLWGPFFMALIFGIFINSPVQFLMLFAAIFGGSLVVTFNTRTLGGKISFFESISVLGYCVFPMFLAGALIKLLGMVNFSHMVVKLSLVLVGAIWGVFSAQAFIAKNVPAKKRGVSLYPILLFYLFIGLMVLYM